MYDHTRNIIVLTIFLSFLGGAVSAAGEEALHSLLESLRDNMRKGPPLMDPLVLGDRTIPHRSSTYSSNLHLHSMVLTVGRPTFRPIHFGPTCFRPILT